MLKQDIKGNAQYLNNPYVSGITEVNDKLDMNNGFNKDTHTSKSKANTQSNTNHSKTTKSKATKSNTARCKKLHVLLVTETWYPDVNGVAMSLGQLMNQIVLAGHTVSLVRPKPKASNISSEDSTVANSENANSAKNSLANIDAQHRDAKSEEILPIISNDIQVTGVNIPKYSELQFGMPAYFTIKKHLAELQPDIVHIATEGPLGLAALMAAKSQKISATTGYHTQFHDFSRHFGLGVLAGPLMAYFKWFHNASKATCVPSKKTYNDLDALGFKRLYEVGRGVDLKKFNPDHRNDELRAKWGANKHHTVLMMVSRLSPEKGVDLVIKSFKSLQQEQLQRAVKLVIVGDGPDRTRLEAMASDNTEDIIFTGAKTGHELAEHYASGDAFVFASLVETFGNVVVEAMASGLPVYAYNDAAAGMLVNEDRGALVPVGDKKSFIKTISELPKMKVLKQQGREASKAVSEFSWQRPANHMLEMFYDALSIHN